MDPDDVPGRLLPSAFYRKQAAISNGGWPLQKPLNIFSRPRGSHPQFLQLWTLELWGSKLNGYTVCEKFSSLNGQVKDFIFQSRSWQLWPMGLAACFFFFFLNNLWAKDHLFLRMFLNGQKHQQKKNISWYENDMKSRFQWPCVKALSSTAMFRCLHIVYGCFPTTWAEQLWQRQHGPQSLKYLFSGPLHNQFSNFCFRT